MMVLISFFCCNKYFCAILKIFQMKNKKDDCLCASIEALPRISLILPFEPKMNKPSQLLNLLTAEADKIEKELIKNYPEETLLPLINKLHRIINTIHCPANKSIGIFVSAFADKVYYFTPTLEIYKKDPPVLIIKQAC
jgi:hypothetical protein